MGPLRFSVVMFLPDARGVSERSVRSWSADQDFDRGRFELVLVSDGREPGTEGRVGALLGATDRLLVSPGASRTHLYDQGARAARGEVVVFTESHCLAEPGLLAALDRCLRDTGAHAALAPLTAAPGGGTLARIEARINLDALREYHEPGDWRKVNIHSFALGRDWYLEAGGLRPRYGMFSEMLLAAELWRRGCRAVLADAPPVGHVFEGTPREIEAFQRDAVPGELRYHADHPHGPHIGHTFLADGDAPWTERELERAALVALWAGGRRGARRAALRCAWRVLKLTASEGRAGRAWDRARVRLAALGCRLLGADRDAARRLFLWQWATAARMARKEHFATAPAEPPVGFESGAVTIDRLPARDALGLHLPERWCGEPVRWTGPCVALRLPHPPSGCLDLVTRGVGWPLAGRVRAVVANGRRLRATSVTVEPGRVRVRVGAGTGALVLAVSCAPVRPEERGPAEPRELGFPLFRVEDAAGARAAPAGVA